MPDKQRFYLHHVPRLEVELLILHTSTPKLKKTATLCVALAAGLLWSRAVAQTTNFPATTDFPSTTNFPSTTDMSPISDFPTTTDFPVVEKVVVVPTTKANRDSQKPVDEPKEEPEKPPVDPAVVQQEMLVKELKPKIIGAWALVPPVDNQYNVKALETAAKRCFEQLKLSNLQFEKGAKVELPDIGGLFGDIVYYPTEAGIQRLDIKSGQVLLLTQFAKQEISATNTIWAVGGKLLRYKIRFSERKFRSKTMGFLLEQDRLYLRCPLKNDPFATVEQ